MKKKKFLKAALPLCFLLFLASCASEQVVETTFDPSLPPSSSAKVLFWLDIETYNGIDIHEAWGGDGDIPLVTLPQGEAEFDFTAYFSRDYGRIVERHTISECRFRYNFEGGKEYTVRWFLEKKPKKFLEVQEYQYYVRIYGKLPGNLKGYNSSSTFKEEDLLASIFIFDTEEYKD